MIVALCRGNGSTTLNDEIKTFEEEKIMSNTESTAKSVCIDTVLV